MRKLLVEKKCFWKARGGIEEGHHQSEKKSSRKVEPEEEERKRKDGRPHSLGHR